MTNDKNIESALGLAIRTARLRKGLSQEGLAFECNLHRTYIGSIERGERNVSLRNIVLISHKLGISASELLKLADL